VKLIEEKNKLLLTKNINLIFFFYKKKVLKVMKYGLNNYIIFINIFYDKELQRLNYFKYTCCYTFTMWFIH